MVLCQINDRIQDVNEEFITKLKVDEVSNKTDKKDEVKDSNLKSTDLNKDLDDNRKALIDQNDSNIHKQIAEWKLLIESLTSTCNQSIMTANSSSVDRDLSLEEQVNNNDKKDEKTDSNLESNDLESDNQTTVIDQNDSDLDKQVEEWKSLIQTLISNSELMSYALAKERTEFKLVKDVGDYLADCIEAKSVTEKAWVVYVWITHNIAYDVESFLSGDFQFCNPQNVLERGLGVCSGYAELYKMLCTHLGVECIEIGGYSKGIGYKVGQKMTEENHAWNAIALGSDGKLRFIESTWGAGHLDGNKAFVKKFEPYYFAMPAHIFNERHHSDSYTPTDGTNKFTLEEFEKCPNNKLGYHILGLSSVNNTMRAINRTTQNPLVLEYTSPQRVYFLVSLIDVETGDKIENAAFVQSEYSYSKDHKSKYCLIVDIPEKGRDYKLRIFAKNDDKCGEGNSFSMITEFLVIREGDEEINIPKYNLTFKHDIKLKSHYSQLIKFDTNPLIMEFEVPNDVKTSFKVVTLDGNKDDNVELSQTNSVSSKTILQITLPRKNEKFILQIFARHENDKSMLFFIHAFISNLFLIQTQ